MFYASRFLRYEPTEIMSGPDVRILQEALSKTGYYQGKIDGLFGSKTELALLKFQTEHQIIADGIAGPDTWNILNLYSPYVKDAQLTFNTKLPRIHIDVNKRRLTFFKTDNSSKTYKIAVGRPSNPTPLGNWVIVQKALNPGGPFGVRWMRLSVPWGGYGIHGTNNPKSIGRAVSHGCIRLFNEDVIEIYALTPIGTPVNITGTAYSARPLKRGDTGKDVIRVQRMLKRLGFYRYKIDGDFGELTEDAVIKFQIAKDLTPDGIVGPATYEKLYKEYDKVTKNTAP